jgi:hypothetical protein
MTHNPKKEELIDWIDHLDDEQMINRLLKLKKEAGKTRKTKSGSRIYGSGKHLIKYVADDFNEALDMFKSYEK